MYRSSSRGPAKRQLQGHPVVAGTIIVNRTNRSCYRIHLLLHGYALEDVAILDTVFGAQVLMLAIVVLMGLHDAYTRDADFVERPVMTTSAEPIQPINQHHIEVGQVAVGQWPHGAGSGTNRRIPDGYWRGGDIQKS